MQTPPPTPEDHAADNGLLDELASLTGLFNPENIWKEEELLDDMDEQEAARQPAQPADDAPHPAA